MGYTLKLDIYYFTLKKIKEETTRRVRGGERVIYLTEKEECVPLIPQHYYKIFFLST